MDNIPTWLGVLLTVMGTFGGAFGLWIINFIKARNEGNLNTSKHEAEAKLKQERQDKEIRIAENEQAFKIYKDLLEGLREDVGKMSNDLNKLEQDHLRAREENASLKAELRALTKENDYLRAQLKMPSPAVEEKKT